MHHTVSNNYTYITRFLDLSIPSNIVQGAFWSEWIFIPFIKFFLFLFFFIILFQVSPTSVMCLPMEAHSKQLNRMPQSRIPKCFSHLPILLLMLSYFVATVALWETDRNEADLQSARYQQGG